VIFSRSFKTIKTIVRSPQNPIPLELDELELLIVFFLSKIVAVVS